MSRYGDAWTNMDPDTRAAIEDNRIDQEEREYNKRKEFIEKFQNGWEKYQKEPLFRSVAEAIARGAEPWDIIDKLIDMNQEQAEGFRKVLQAWPSGHEWPQL